MLSKDFKEFIALLNAHDVRYLVVGGYALAFHGYPRYTKDLDVWIEPSPGNADRIIDALDDFGFGSLGPAAADFLESETIIQLGYPPHRIDLLTTITGVAFEDCYRVKDGVDIEGVHIDFIDSDNFKKNKRATGRPRDAVDADSLEES